MTATGLARAVRCALAIGSALRELGLEIRAGIHTGEVELTDEGVQGIAVHIGARVAPPEDTECADWGLHRELAGV